MIAHTNKSSIQDDVKLFFSQRSLGVDGSLGKGPTWAWTVTSVRLFLSLLSPSAFSARCRVCIHQQIASPQNLII